MESILKKIITVKKQEVEKLKREGTPFHASEDVPSRRDFIAALNGASPLHVIAEIKKASPSKGVICADADFNPSAIADTYYRGGAHAVSVLTDAPFFQGSVAYLELVRKTVPLPVVRKDVIIDPLQVEQTAVIGADAMLLIAAALDDIQMRDLFEAARALEVQPLVEIHNRGELDRVMKLDPSLVGINNRNLETFETDIQITLDLMRYIPDMVTVVSESGIRGGREARCLEDAGVNALLVGEALMRQDDPAPLLRELSGGTLNLK